MPVVILANYLRYAISPFEDFYPTGPGLVTKDTAEKVNSLTADNFR